MSGVQSIVASRRRSWMTVLAALLFAGGVGATAVPAMEYLPTGNRNFMFAVVVPPTGYGVEEMHKVGQQEHERSVGPHAAPPDVDRGAVTPASILVIT